jgi:hypothetical protein
MAPGVKNRVISPTLNMTTTAIIIGTIILDAKAIVSKMSKPEPFVGFRYKFKAFYT